MPFPIFPNFFATSAPNEKWILRQSFRKLTLSRKIWWKKSGEYYNITEVPKFISSKEINKVHLFFPNESSIHRPSFKVGVSLRGHK